MKTFILTTAFTLVSLAQEQPTGRITEFDNGQILPPLNSSNYINSTADTCNDDVDEILGIPRLLATRGNSRCDQICVDADQFARSQDKALCYCMANLSELPEGNEKNQGIAGCECDAGLGNCES